jgi:hypothetical protein
VRPAAVGGIIDFNEDEDEDNVADLNGLITNLQVLIHLRKSMLVLRTYL